MSTVVQITDAIERLDAKAQAELLLNLPNHLKISPEDLGWAQVSESAFGFWNNPDDAGYGVLARPNPLVFRGRKTNETFGQQNKSELS